MDLYFLIVDINCQKNNDDDKNDCNPNSRKFQNYLNRRSWFQNKIFKNTNGNSIKRNFGIVQTVEQCLPNGCPQARYGRQPSFIRPADNEKKLNL